MPAIVTAMIKHQSGASQIAYPSFKTIDRVLEFVHPWIRTVSTRLYQIARIQWLSIALIGLLGFVGSAAVGLMVGIPVPDVSDEFGYWLAADTFAHGRLTNPTHPMWIHFESIGIIQQPTYMAKYPPAQGLVLAAGQVIGGHPIWGVWVSVGLMCAAICWMLYIWVPPKWAVLGGFLAVIHPALGITGYWAQSYWGGAVPAIGGALVAGALRRIIHRPRIHSALLLSLGLAVLANSRPYEGLVVSLPAGVVLLIWLYSRHGPPLGISIKRIVLPIFIVVAITGAAMAYYNLRVTGKMFHLPYQVHEETYATAPLFLWQPPRPEPVYHDPVIRENHRAQLDTYFQQRSIVGFLSWKKAVVGGLWDFYLGKTFTIPLIAMLPIMVAWTLRNRWALFALLTCSGLMAGFLVSTSVLRHYAAPVTGFIFMFVLQAMRFWRWRDKVVGQFVVCLVVFLSVCWLGRSLYGATKQDGSSGWPKDRARILRQLEQEPGRHLVLVSYGPKHSFAREWVYNEADIDDAKVILARDMGETQNRELLEYFKGRNIWLLDVDWDFPHSVNLYGLKSR